MIPTLLSPEIVCPFREAIVTFLAALVAAGLD
jgi:hypothetical protein